MMGWFEFMESTIVWRTQNSGPSGPSDSGACELKTPVSTIVHVRAPVTHRKFKTPLILDIYRYFNRET